MACFFAQHFRHFFIQDHEQEIAFMTTHIAYKDTRTSNPQPGKLIWLTGPLIISAT
jgi:hypothetical protein